MKHWMFIKYFFLVLLLVFLFPLVVFSETTINSEISAEEIFSASPNAEIATVNMTKVLPTELSAGTVAQVQAEDLQEHGYHTHNPGQKNLTLEADNVDYQEENRFVEASGNVLVVYKNYQVSANQTELDVAYEQLKIPDDFVLHRSGRRFEGRLLDYNLAKDEGTAKDIAMDFGGAVVKGKDVDIRREKIVVSKASFTRCTAVNPCYRFQAETLTIYPEWNMMVAKNAVFYAADLPLMYMPTYIIDKNTNEYRDVIPEFGRNETEGDFIKTKIGYHRDEKIQGNYDLHYLSRLGYRVGVTNHYIWDDISAGNIRLHYVGNLGFTGGVTYKTLIGAKNRQSSQRIEDFFSQVLPPSSEDYPEMVLDISGREILGDQFVSFLPMLTLNTAHYKIGIGSWKLRGSVSVADIKEEFAYAITDKEEYDKLVSNNIEPYAGGVWQRFQRQKWNARVFNSYDLGSIGRLSGELVYDKSGYYEGSDLRGYWHRFSTGWGLGRRITFWDYSLNYRHVFSEGGFSPFAFDQFNLSTWDEVGMGLGLWLGNVHRLGYHVDYAVRENEYRNEDISLNILMHHWQLSFIFRTKLKQTYFNVSLQ